MSYKITNCSLFLILFKMIMFSADLAASRLCPSNCGGIQIPYPFGIGKACSLNKYYDIECRNSTNTSRKHIPFLSLIGKEVVNISLPNEGSYYYGSKSDEFVYSRQHGLVRVKSSISSTGCSVDGKDRTESIMNLTGSPFFSVGINSLAAVGCNSKVSLTNIKPSTMGCELNCNRSKDDWRRDHDIPFFNKTGCSRDIVSYGYNDVCTESKLERRECDGNGCCQVSLPNEPQQVIGVKIESNDGNLTTREEDCRVAFITDEIYSLSNAAKQKELYANGYSTITLGWIIQTRNNSFLDSLVCKSKYIYENTTYIDARKITCICQKSTISEISYANCECNNGYTGNPYVLDGCKDTDECKTTTQLCGKGETCVNTLGAYQCVVGKRKAIMIGVGAGFGVLVLISGLWGLRKCIIKRRITKRKKKFFERNGGLLLKQELNTRENNVEKTRIFSSRELEKATENFSENRVLGQGGQGTVYKGMLVDGRTVAVKKSKVIDEDKLQEFINEVVILSQINHRHIVKLLGCCLETEVPILVYEFILNGNLFQHIHEESSDEYTMNWGMRLRLGVEIAGALSYLHSSASSPIYHRDIKSTNILLDEKYRAKVADFGTSRSITIDQTHWTTVISGTVGYVDPEYYRSSQYTEKSDVYSFGVVLAELITGVKPVLTMQDTRETISLAEHFKIAMKEGRFSSILDTRIKDDCKPEQVMAVANLALKCLSSKGRKRPNMKQVLMELEKICTSPEDSKVQIQIDEEDDDEEEVVMKMINISVTAPDSSIVTPSSSSDVEPLFPPPTW